MSEYPEHDKLHTVVDQSQAQGAFVEWLSEQGISLMVWREWDEPTEDECPRCGHRTREQQTSGRYVHCDVCDNTGTYTHTIHYARHVPDGRSIQTLLAEYHGINQRKLEQEKRAMLASLRAS